MRWAWAGVIDTARAAATEVLPDWLAAAGFVLQREARARECHGNWKVQITGIQNAWVLGKEGLTQFAK